MIIGTPGSGKTTLARLFEFRTLRTLLRSSHMNRYGPLVDILTSCGAIRNEYPVLVGGRLPLEAEYREFWELPYPEELRARLMMQLLQARAVLAWLRHIQDSGVPLEQVEIVPRADAYAAIASVGGRAGLDLRNRARDVERAIYGILGRSRTPGHRGHRQGGDRRLPAVRRHRSIPNSRRGGGSAPLPSHHARRCPQPPSRPAPGSSDAGLHGVNSRSRDGY